MLSIDTFLLCLPSTTANTGRGVVKFYKLLILAIIRCPYTGDIIYYLCDTITYTTSTSATWYLHDHFVEVYFYTLVELVTGPHKKLGLKSECVTRSLIRTDSHQKFT